MNDTPTDPPTSDGGPAFPFQSIGPEFMSGHCGMSLRDYFAGQALVGLLTLSANGRSNVRLADEAYVYADAMLAARERKSNG